MAICIKDSSPLLSRLPWWLTRWVGYRAPVPDDLPHPTISKNDGSSRSRKQVWAGEFNICFWSFVASFCAISIIQAVFHTEYFSTKGAPTIVASFGSSAVLLYGTIDSPYAQPRCLLGGHFAGALIGICITKLIHLLPTEEQFLRYEWLAGSLSCALSVVVMQLTGTVHPPAGATALLATVNADVRDLSWYFLPIILLTSSLALVVALLINNIQRRYPRFWFFPDSPKDAAKIPIPISQESQEVLRMPQMPPPVLPAPPPPTHPVLQVAVPRFVDEPPRSPLTPSRPTF